MALARLGCAGRSIAINNLLARFRIGAQISVIGVIGVVGLIALGFIYLQATTAQSAYDRIRTRAEKAETLVIDLRVNLLRAQRHEKDFQLYYKKEFSERHAASMDLVTRQLGELADMEHDATTAFLIGDVAVGVQQYVAAFATLVHSAETAGLDETQGALGELRGAAHEIEGALDDLNHPEIFGVLLMMRRYEKDFLARLDPSRAEAVKQLLPEFEAALTRVPLESALRTDLMQKMAIYQRAFARMTQAKLDEAAADEAASAAYGALDPVLLDLGKTFRSSLLTARAVRDAAQERAEWTILTGIGLVVGAVGAMAWLVGRTIARPIGRMVGVMRKLAAGDLEVEMLGGERRDEVGTLARAFRLFQDQARLARSLQVERDRQNRDLLTESQRLGKLGYALFDLASDSVRWSDTLFELRRMPPRASFTLAESLQFVHPEDLSGFSAGRAAALAEGRAFKTDVRVLRGDGTIGWDHRIIVPRFDVRGSFTGVLSVVQDITERRLAEEALKRQEADLQAIMDNAPLMIFLKDRGGRYRLANRAYAKLRGIEPRDIIGRVAADVVPSFAIRRVVESDRAVLERGEIVIDEFTRKPYGDGDEPGHLLVTKFPTRDESGAITGLAGFILDITQREQAKDALRQSEERFRALIEHSSDRLAVIRSDGMITYQSPSSPSPSSANPLRYQPEDAVGSSVFARVHPEDVEAFTEEFRRIAAVPRGVATGRCRVRGKSGSWHHLAWSARNATDVPAVDGIIMNSHDITEAIGLEEQLRQAQKMEAVGQLAGGIAHDFNNIIGAVLGFARFLTEDLPVGSEVRHYAERIVSAGDKAQSLVQHILAFSRQTGVERQFQDIAGVVRGTEGLLRAALPSSTRLDLRIDQEALIANVNAAQIDQVLLNLCVNANDALAGEPGTVSIVVTRVMAIDEDGAVVPSVEDAASGAPFDRTNRIASGSLDVSTPYARIAISDTGIGMSPEIMGRVFEPFFTTKERGRGTGLGLSIVHGVVMDYGGVCRVESRLGHGTTFAVYIPLETGVGPPAARPFGQVPVRGRERVLVVEDEPDVADVLVIGLGRLGYAVTAVGNPHDALVAFERSPETWDVVVSDQVMPGMKGTTLFARFKAIKPSLRFILCTGFSDVATEKRVLESGVDAFFIKPVSPERIAASIREIAAHRAGLLMPHHTTV